jgi:hypothetical protein
VNDPHPKITRGIQYNPDSRMFDLSLWNYTTLRWEVIGEACCYLEGELTLNALEAEIEAEQERWYGTPEGSPGWAA